MASEESQTFTERLEAGSEKYLTLAELFVVLTLALTVMIITVLTLIWIVGACSLRIEQERLTTSLETLNNNWKAVLILIIPLFYRTIRKFLARVTRLPGGVEAVTEDEKVRPELSPMKPNPPREEEA
jgi:hypothetical protein